MYPKQFYSTNIPAFCCSQSEQVHGDEESLVEAQMFGLVTKALNRSQWSVDPKALDAIAKEKQGLRDNKTWDDSTACDLDQLVHQSKTLGMNIHIAELLVFCGIKHAELDETLHKHKGRIVHRGDKVFTQNGDIVLFTEVSTSPTTLIALNVCLWWGAL